MKQALKTLSAFTGKSLKGYYYHPTEGILLAWAKDEDISATFVEYYNGEEDHFLEYLLSDIDFLHCEEEYRQDLGFDEYAEECTLGFLLTTNTISTNGYRFHYAIHGVIKPYYTTLEK